MIGRVQKQEGSGEAAIARRLDLRGLRDRALGGVDELLNAPLETEPRAVTLPSTGSYVQWTTRAATNTLVVRASIPDSAGGTGQTSTVSIYVNGTFHKKITLNSKFSGVSTCVSDTASCPGGLSSPAAH